MDEVADSDDAGCHRPRTQSWVLSYLSKVRRTRTNTIVSLNSCRHHMLGCTSALVNLKLTGGAISENNITVCVCVERAKASEDLQP